MSTSRARVKPLASRSRNQPAARRTMIDVSGRESGAGRVATPGQELSSAWRVYRNRSVISGKLVSILKCPPWMHWAAVSFPVRHRSQEVGVRLRLPIFDSSSVFEDVLREDETALFSARAEVLEDQLLLAHAVRAPAPRAARPASARPGASPSRAIPGTALAQFAVVCSLCDPLPTIRGLRRV
jgi:hypothetical protein